MSRIEARIVSLFQGQGSGSYDPENGMQASRFQIQHNTVRIAYKSKHNNKNGRHY